MSVTLNDLEDKLKEALESLSLFARVEHYTGDIEDVLKGITTRFPACFIVHQGARFERVSNLAYQKVVQYSLLIGAQSYRSDEHARHQSAGTNALLEAVEAKLLGQTLGVSLSSPWEPVSVDLLNMVKKGAGMGLSVYDARWEAGYTVAATSEEEAELKAVEARYYLKPGDEQSDAADEISLESE